MSENSSDSFRSSPLWRDVRSTILSGPKQVNFDTQARIHTKDGDFNVIKILDTQEKSDYTVDTCGSIHMRFYVGLGDYIYKLYPYRDMLEVSLKKIPQTEDTGVDPGVDAPAVRYRANLDLEKNQKPTGTRMPNLDYNTLQTANDMVEVSLELLDRNFEVLRSATIPGDSFQDVSPHQLISGLMVGMSLKFNVDGSPSISAFDIVEPDNTGTMEDILIPSNLKIANVPTFVQEKLSGVYSTGVGTFFQRYKGHPAWFVYPLYNTERFKEDVDRLVIYAVPEDMLSGIDRTFRQAGKIVYIAATGQQGYDDDSKISDVNEGVGFRQADATGIITKPVDLTKDGPVADRARLNLELAGRERGDGIYYAPTLAPSVNPFKQYSRVAARQIAKINAVWENSQPDLIHPGMPVKYVFMDGGEYREVTGTVLGKYTVSTLVGAPVTSSTYKTSTTIAMATGYFGEAPKQPVTNSPGRY